MEYMTIQEAAKAWNLSVRRVQTICNEGMVPGVVKFGHVWAIPKGAEKPVDKRIKSYCSESSQTSKREEVRE